MKKQHPIRKLSWAVQRHVHGECDSVDCDGIERSIARHVKPLLDVATGRTEHLFHGDCPRIIEELVEGGEIQFHQTPQCPACRILIEWRAKL